MDNQGYLDRLFVHKNYQGKGIGSQIVKELESNSTSKLFLTHASITAKPFFETMGYQVIKENQVELRGEVLINYIMEKTEKVENVVPKKS